MCMPGVWFRKGNNMNINDAIDNAKQDLKEAKKEAFELLHAQGDFLIMARSRVQYDCQNIISIDAAELMMKLVVQLKKVEALTQKLTTLEDCSY